MNCRRIEKLIPLYVEGDLDIAQTDKVRAHAKGCASCGALVAEYKESQRWLRSFAPPHFDDALLEDLKAGVLEKIDGRETRASFLNRVAGSWMPKLAFAASVALLIVFGAVALYTHQNSRDEILAEGEVEQTEQSPATAAQSKDVELAPRASFSPKRHRHSVSVRHRSAAVRGDASAEHAIARRDNMRFDPAAAAETRGGIAGDPSASKEMLRIEIQTSDPNIRIIWFSPKESNSNPQRPTTDTE